MILEALGIWVKLIIEDRIDLVKCEKWHWDEKKNATFEQSKHE